MVFITAVLDNMQPAMSETSLDFRCFCDINQNLEAQWLSFLTLCLVNLEDLVFDVLLCDVNFSHFSSQVFLPSY